jgi:mannose-6-phosphate isomerase-like protein (cupin superfamily)
MPVRLIERPMVVKAAGNKPKLIEEFVGKLNTGTLSVSIARMVSPRGWSEPKQTPDFDEYTIVLRGFLRVESNQGTLDVGPGQGVHAPRGESVQYSTPGPEGAEYISVCLPAFTVEGVHRDADRPS